MKFNVVHRVLGFSVLALAAASLVAADQGCPGWDGKNRATDPEHIFCRNKLGMTNFCNGTKVYFWTEWKPIYPEPPNPPCTACINRALYSVSGWTYHCFGSALCTECTRTYSCGSCGDVDQCQTDPPQLET